MLKKNLNSKKKIIEKQFIERVGYKPNIKNPKSYNEKIQWYKLHYRDPLMTQCADKYRVREYVKKTIGKKYLIPLFGVYDSAEDINFDKLPNQFVLKTNNSSGKNFICKDKSKINKGEIIDQFKEWMKPEYNHYNYSFEWCYKNIKPKIICEKYLEQKDKDLYDYKFYCFNGKVEFIRTFRQRYKNILKNTYDLNWKELPYSMDIPNASTQVSKPKNLSLITKLCESLSKEFPLVRIDYYIIDRKIYFGEMTFYPGNGILPLLPTDWDYKLGKKLKLPTTGYKEKIKKYLKYKKTRKAKLVLYTAITNNYDNLIQHKYISKDFDYICYTDSEIKNPGIWEIRKIKDSNINPNRKAKIYKILPHKYLKKYNYSIWIDANIDVNSNKLEKKIKFLVETKKNIAANPHHLRNCIYKEAKTCIDLKKDNPEIILKQIDYLMETKYPGENGLFENNLIFRNHHNPQIIQLMTNWWWLITNFSKRDQLSFNYVLWKNNIVCNKLFTHNARTYPKDFIFKEHSQKIVSSLISLTENKQPSLKLVQKTINIHDNRYQIFFDLEVINYPHKIRLELSLIDKFCNFKINKIFFTNSKGEEIKTSEYKTNGKITQDGYIKFKTFNPYIDIKVPKNSQSVYIDGILDTYDIKTYLSTLDLNNYHLKRQINQISLKRNTLQQELNKVLTENKYLIQKNKEINKNLNKILSSKTYKVWQKYNTVKKTFKKLI